MRKDFFDPSVRPVRGQDDDGGGEHDPGLRGLPGLLLLRLPLPGLLHPLPHLRVLMLNLLGHEEEKKAKKVCTVVCHISVALE